LPCFAAQWRGVRPHLLRALAAAASWTDKYSISCILSAVFCEPCLSDFSRSVRHASGVCKGFLVGLEDLMIQMEFSTGLAGFDLVTAFAHTLLQISKP
jgi:hypothetical protein